MSYLDVLACKTKPRRPGADSDSDDGPPPDPDEPPPPPTTKAKSKAAPEAREVQLSVKKTNDDKMAQTMGGLTQVRKGMLMKLREEAEEALEHWEYRDEDTQQAHESLDKIVSQSRTTSKFYRDVPGSWFLSACITTCIYVAIPYSIKLNERATRQARVTKPNSDQPVFPDFLL
ncbi:hypothetical protein AURDEDRAFT_131983 [Auricularia subglabra TFB-10046 SS5]|uniref:Uncharacterized protein n=1 Tax=Auricularia subglabra (strain TFB-10046 / SS5) TaxID=717982 RepID=J0WKJ3_AURST|nr:hypothetical protein AURDEDRAFT_131983 [Auricularia subglabra TFB-10046 SS5]